MKYIEVVADAGSLDTVAAIAEKAEAADFRTGMTAEDGSQAMRLLVRDDKLQATLDTLQNILGSQTDSRISVLPIEISLPQGAQTESKEEDSAIAAREALLNQVDKGARLNLNFSILVILSSVVAAIGLMEDNVAVVIGAMVIAPLLGPNLAFALGTALGDIPLMKESAGTLLAGLMMAVVVSVFVAMLWPSDHSSTELMARTQVGMDSVALALASGAAAALSLTTGLSSVLVGVMVAVALLPPAATFGLMLGYGETSLAFGAGLLLIINIVCVNLASKLVFLMKRIKPRGWREKEKARRAMTTYVLVWLVTLAILVTVIYFRQVVVS